MTETLIRVYCDVILSHVCTVIVHVMCHCYPTNHTSTSLFSPVYEPPVCCYDISHKTLHYVVPSSLYDTPFYKGIWYRHKTVMLMKLSIMLLSSAPTDWLTDASS